MWKLLLPPKTRQIVDRLLNHASDVLSLIDNLPKNRRYPNRTKPIGAKRPLPLEPTTKKPKRPNPKNDFVHKLQISLKEARESCYWLRFVG